MIQALLTWLATWFTANRSQFREAWDKTTVWRVSFWGVILTVSGWIWSVVHFAGSGFSAAVGSLDAIVCPTIGAPSGTILHIFAVANTATPLEEVFGMAISFVSLLVSLKVGKLLVKTLSWLF